MDQKEKHYRLANQRKKNRIRRNKRVQLTKKERNTDFEQEAGSVTVKARLYSQLKQKETIGLLLLLTAVLFFFLYLGTHQVDGQSMAPTFQSGDRIIIVKNHPVNRYDIVTFEPKNIVKGESYVKRVIGMPGDAIHLAGTSLFILPEGSQDAFHGKEGPLMEDGALKITVSKFVAHTLNGLKRIPEDQYFVEGDNRLHSDDSRVFGLVEDNQIEGVVAYRYYPFNKMGFIQ